MQATFYLPELDVVVFDYLVNDFRTRKNFKIPRLNFLGLQFLALLEVNIFFVSELNTDNSVIHNQMNKEDENVKL